MPTKRVTKGKLTPLVEEKKAPAKKKTSTKKLISNGSDTEPVKKIKIANRSKKATPKAEPVVTHLNVADATPLSTSVAITNSKIQLALLSPFRFPVDNDRLASQVARFAGVFFVVVGAIFTLLNFQYVGSGYFAAQGSYNVAETISGSGNCIATTSPDYNQLNCTSGSSTTPIVTNPQVDIRFERQEPFTDVVPIMVYVPLATEVIVYIKNLQDYQKITLPPATRMDDLSWRFYWPTAQYADGTYKVIVFVKNAYGQQYEYIRPNTVEVLNHPLPIPGTSSSSASTTSDSTAGSGSTTPPVDYASTTQNNPSTTPTGTASTTPVTPKIILTIPETSPLHGNATIKISVPNATNVKLHAHKANVTNFTYLGTAKFYGEDEWRYEWETKTVVDGTYVVQAQAIYGDISYVSKTLTVGVDNVTDATTTVQNTQPTASTTPTLEPTISLIIPEASPISGDTDLHVTVVGALSVEMFALPRNSLTSRYLGSATMQNSSEWYLKWNTKLTPNGEYYVFATVKNQFGPIDSRKTLVTIKNEIPVVQTEEQAKTVTDLQAINTILKETTVPVGETVPPTSQPQIPPVQPIYLTPVSEIIDEVDVTSEEKESLDQLLQDFRSKIETDLNRLSRAIRNEDEDEIKKIKAHIESIRQEIVETLPVSKEKGEIISKIDEHLKKVVNELQELALRNEQIIKERIGDAVTKDSDKDGISDYDEVNLYATDPFNPDSDGDGFIDGTEVMAGYDPKNSVPETLVVYESPQELGVVREDLFVVETIATIPKINPDSTVTEGANEGAIITGKGLPNSFVTLYIYSTPIVVTVKTDENGSWIYTFDKELDNGEHEVYVGMTDNAGRIVAKSNPLKFIKTAEAFTPIDAAGAVVVTEDTEPSLINQNMLLVIVSIAVVAIGLVLILLGLHVNSRKILEPVTQ